MAGRPPEHWTYPDLAPIAPEAVIQTALGEVGKTYPYNLLKFNCEHFAIYCKSGGQTYNSVYAVDRRGVRPMWRCIRSWERLPS